MTKTLRNYDRYCNYMRDNGEEPIPFREFVRICIDLGDILEGGESRVESLSNIIGSD